MIPSKEEKYLDNFSKGIYKPDLLFSDPGRYEKENQKVVNLFILIFPNLYFFFFWGNPTKKRIIDISLAKFLWNFIQLWGVTGYIRKLPLLKFILRCGNFPLYPNLQKIKVKYELYQSI